MQKVKNSTGYKRGSRGYKVMIHSVLFGLLVTVDTYKLEKYHHEKTVTLYVRVGDHYTWINADDFYDLPQLLGEWLVSLPKDVWDAAMEVYKTLQAALKIDTPKK